MIYRVKSFNGVQFSDVLCTTAEAMRCEASTVQTARKFRRLEKHGIGVKIYQTTGEIVSLYGEPEYLQGAAEVAQILGLNWEIIVE